MLWAYRNWSTGKLVYSTLDILHAREMYVRVTVLDGMVIADKWLPGGKWLSETKT